MMAGNIVASGRRIWIEHNGDPFNAGRNLLEKFEPFPPHCRLYVNEPGYIRTGPEQVRHKSSAYRI
jgi:hypothetical protein